MIPVSGISSFESQGGGGHILRFFLVKGGNAQSLTGRLFYSLFTIHCPLSTVHYSLFPSNTSPSQIKEKAGLGFAENIPLLLHNWNSQRETG
jgi:hypothetical protein